MTPEEELIQGLQCDGSVGGKLVEITAKPVKITEGRFSVDAAIPPLHRPQIEVLLEHLRCRGETDLEAWRASLADKEVQIGPYVKIRLESLVTLGETREEASGKLGRLAGHAVAQVYLKFLLSEDPAQIEAARSMEIGQGSTEQAW